MSAKFIYLFRSQEKLNDPNVRQFQKEYFSKYITLLEATEKRVSMLKIKEINVQENIPCFLIFAPSSSVPRVVKPDRIVHVLRTILVYINTGKLIFF